MTAQTLSIIEQYPQPEVTLLRLCARAALKDVHLTSIRELLQHEIDWSYLLWLARHNRVQPLLYRGLKTANVASIPEWVIQRLSNASQNVTVSNLYLTRSLLQIIKELQAKDVPAIPYKGPLLAHTVYGDVGLRQFGDLDIIVPEESVPLAKEIVMSAGFSQVWPEMELNGEQEAVHICQKYNYEFIRESDGLDLELHWDISPNYLNCPKQRSVLWQRLDTVMLAGKQIHSFPVEELLVILAVHGSNHCWIRLSWICDIAELVRANPAIDWAYTLQLAASWGGKRMLLIALSLVETVLGTELPSNVSNLIHKDQIAVTLAKQSHKWMFAPRYLYFRPFEEPLYHLRMREAWRDRFHYLEKMMAPGTTDWAALPLPHPLRFFYYVLRPLRIGYTHGIKLLKKT